MRKLLGLALIGALIGFAAPVDARICASADLNYYVATGGSDLNDGSEAFPWETPTWAARWVQNNIDFCGKKVTIHLSGAGCRPFRVVGPYVGQVSPSSLVFLGDAVNPSNCTITAQTGAAISIWELAAVRLNGIQVSATQCGSNQASGIIVQNARVYLAGVWFGFSCWAHLHALGNMTHVSWVGGNVIVHGSATFGFLAEDKAQVNLNGATISYYSAVGYTHAFAWASQAAVLDFTGVTFVRNGFSVTGRRYLSEQGALIRSGGNVLPGNVDGMTQTHGLVM
jgi:hypothetical protein